MQCQCVIEVNRSTQDDLYRWIDDSVDNRRSNASRRVAFKVCLACLFFCFSRDKTLWFMNFLLDGAFCACKSVSPWL